MRVCVIRPPTLIGPQGFLRKPPDTRVTPCLPNKRHISTRRECFFLSRSSGNVPSRHILADIVWYPCLCAGHACAGGRPGQAGHQLAVQWEREAGHAGDVVGRTRGRFGGGARRVPAVRDGAGRSVGRQRHPGGLHTPLRVPAGELRIIVTHNFTPTVARFDATHDQGLKVYLSPKAEVSGQAGVFCFFCPIFISPFGDTPKM